MERYKVLIIEDDEDIRFAVKALLENEGYSVAEASNGKTGLELADSDTDLVIMDIMMPGDDGVETCRKLRERSNVPVLFLTAKITDVDRYKALMSGGDDYMGKPFSFDDLKARVTVLIRRYRTYQGKSNNVNDPILEYGGIRLDRTGKELTVDGEPVRLTDIEFQVLSLLMSNKDKTFSARELYEAVWHESYLYSSSSTVMVHIRRLRTKIEKTPDEPEHIKTVWGKGYRFE